MRMLFRLSLFTAVSVSVLLVGGGIARAQTGDAPGIALMDDARGIVHDRPDSTDLRLNQFNGQDCLADEEIVFNLTVRGDTSTLNGSAIEAWLGAACEQASNRASGACVELSQALLSVRRMLIPARALRQFDAGSEWDSSCTSSSTTPTSGLLTFMLLDGDGVTPAGAGSDWYVQWPFTYDVGAPSAPIAVQATPTAGGLRVTWEHPDAPPDLAGYVLLCDPPLAATGAGGAGAAADPAAICGSTALVVGAVPTADQLATYTCAALGLAATSGETAPLTSGVTYAVGVVARDNYGNLSPLSELACGTPHPPVDAANSSRTSHVELSRGGCGVGRARPNGAGILLLVGGLASLVRRRRRPVQ